MWEYFKRRDEVIRGIVLGLSVGGMTVKAWNWLEWRSWKKVESLLTSVPLLGERKTRTGNATYKMAWSLKVIQNRMVGPLFNAWRIQESWEEKLTLVNSSGMRQVGHLIYCAIARSWAFWNAGVWRWRGEFVQEHGQEWKAEWVCSTTSQLRICEDGVVSFSFQECGWSGRILTIIIGAIWWNFDWRTAVWEWVEGVDIAQLWHGWESGGWSFLWSGDEIGGFNL